MRGSMDRHRAPPAADVEQTGARSLVQSELATDELVLGGLSLVEGGVGVREAGARVRHAGAQHQSVEVVADVVVVTYRRRIATHRVTPAAQACLFRRWRQRAAQCTDLLRRLHRRGQGAQRRVRRQRHRLGLAKGNDGIEDVAVEVDVADDVRTADTELVGHPQQPPKGVRGVEPKRCHGLIGAQRRAVPELEPQRQIETETVFDQGSHRFGHMSRRVRPAGRVLSLGL